MASPRQTILLVEDEYASLEVLELLLEREGFKVVAVSNAEEALEHLGAGIPDLVLTDYMMPGLDGIELAEALSKRDDTKGIPIILMSSAFSGQLDGANIVAFVRKPFLFDRLLEKIQEALKKEP